jgi:hypothetical protein
MYTLTINDERVWLFYNTYKNIDFETTNRLLVELLEKLMSSPSEANGFILLQQQLKLLTEQVNKTQDNISMNVTLKLNEMKKDYLEDVKMILSNNVGERISPLFKDCTSSIIDKTQLVLNELLPHHHKHIFETISQLKEALTKESATNLHEVILGLDQKFSQIISNTSAVLSNTESKLDAGFKDIRHHNDHHFSAMKDLTTLNQQNVSDILKKMDNSSLKGKLSENIVFNILHTLYPCGQIDFVGTTKETGDIILSREGKPTILIENKSWDKNVVQEEVKKFIHDVDSQKCCGLFLSQNYGIATKQNFEINIHNGNILLYLHNVHNDADKIKTGIDIIDHFKESLDVLGTDVSSDVITKETLDEIYNEYAMYVSQVTNMQRLLKDFNGKMNKQLDEIKLPCLKKYLSTKYSFSSNVVVCDICNEFAAKNAASLHAHQRACIKKER